MVARLRERLEGLVLASAGPVAAPTGSSKQRQRKKPQPPPQGLEATDAMAAAAEAEAVERERRRRRERREEKHSRRKQEPEATRKKAGAAAGAPMGPMAWQITFPPYLAAEEARCRAKGKPAPYEASPVIERFRPETEAQQRE